MYSPNRQAPDDGDRINIPPDYSGNAMLREPIAEPFDNGPHESANPLPPPPPRAPGILDRLSTEDLLLYGAAAFLIFRDGDDDLLSLGILLLIILL